MVNVNLQTQMRKVIIKKNRLYIYQWFQNLSWLRDLCDAFENADSKILHQIFWFGRFGWGPGICIQTRNHEVILEWRPKEHPLRNPDLESIWGEWRKWKGTDVGRYRLLGVVLSNLLVIGPEYSPYYARNRAFNVDIVSIAEGIV